jgi:metal-dependent hydrolase (beta-lactamase superfamily II)
MKKDEYTEKERQIISNTAKELRKMNTLFYTGHCIGDKAISIMKPIMNEQLVIIHSGEEIEKTSNSN